MLAGDIDATWEGLALFAGWPVPVIFVPGNHEFDGRDVDTVVPALADICARLGITLLHRGSRVVTDNQGQRVRFVATMRWSDFDLFGAAGRERAMRSSAYFMRLMAATRDGALFDAAALRDEGLRCRAWLEAALGEPTAGRWDKTVVLTHFAPSLRSADPRYGRQPSTASFCNADDDLIPHADLWLHGHLHCRHDYRVARADGQPPSRVVCQARGLAAKGEADGFDGQRVIEV